jgi:hypothetical protein
MSVDSVLHMPRTTEGYLQIVRIALVEVVFVILLYYHIHPIVNLLFGAGSLIICAMYARYNPNLAIIFALVSSISFILTQLIMLAFLGNISLQVLLLGALGIVNGFAAYNNGNPYTLCAVSTMIAFILVSILGT